MGPACLSILGRCGPVALFAGPSVCVSSLPDCRAAMLCCMYYYMCCYIAPRMIQPCDGRVSAVMSCRYWPILLVGLYRSVPMYYV